DPDKNRTVSMRSKEEAHDYRYFPEPDLLPLKVDRPWVEKMKKTLPELPLQKQQRFMKDFGLPAYDSEILVQSRDMATFYEEVAGKSRNPKAASNWIMGDLLKTLN